MVGTFEIIEENRIRTEFGIMIREGKGILEEL
jgi:hypothetical protein